MTLEPRITRTDNDGESRLERLAREFVKPDPQTPLPREAEEYALMIQSGLPPEDALGYFFEAVSDIDIAKQHWPGHRSVNEAFARFNKGEWQKLQPMARIELALNKHYAEMAYYLWTHHYAEVEGKQLEKADTCRNALEKKLAGTSGLSPLERYWADWTESERRKREQAQEAQTGLARIAHELSERPQ